MLVLTRRVGETFVIGDEITIHVLNVRGKQVRLGIEAPKEVLIYRTEIYERIHETDPGESNQLATALQVNNPGFPRLNDGKN